MILTNKLYFVETETLSNMCKWIHESKILKQLYCLSSHFVKSIFNAIFTCKLWLQAHHTIWIFNFLKSFKSFVIFRGNFLSFVIQITFSQVIEMEIVGLGQHSFYSLHILRFCGFLAKNGFGIFFREDIFYRTSIPFFFFKLKKISFKF